MDLESKRYAIIILFFGVLISITITQVEGQDYLIRTLSGHTGDVYAVAINSDNSKIVSGSHDGTVKIWNLSDGALILSVDTGIVYCIAITPDDTKIVTGGYHSIGVRNFSDGSLIIWWSGHSLDIYGIVITLDSTRVVSAGVDREVKIWNILNGSLLRKLVGHDSIIQAVDITPDQSKIVSGSVDETIRIWNFNDGTEMGVIYDHGNSVYGVKISPDGLKIISGGTDKTVKIWNINDGSLIRILTGHIEYVRAVIATPDSSKIISGSADTTVKIWNIYDGSLVRTLTGHKKEVRCVSVTSDGSKIVSGGGDGVIKIWGLCTAGYFYDFEMQSCKICSPGSYSSGGTSICTLCPVGTCNPSSGATSIDSCILCEAGTYSPSTGRTSCISCEAGSFNPFLGQAECMSCAAGTYNPSTGSTSVGECLECAPGAYSSTNQTVICSLCPEGTYNPFSGKTSCISCMPGTYNPGIGSTSISSCIACAIGTYNNITGQSSCNSCEAGTYNPLVGSTSESACLPCAVGTYNPSIGQSKCITCGSGSNGGVTGSKTMEDCLCLRSTYLDSETRLCKDCPRGFICDGSSHLEVEPGYWQAPSSSGKYIAYKCLNQDACAGGNNTCAKGYNGVLCSSCEKGYGKTGYFCIKCPSDGANGFLVFLSIVIPLTFVLFMIEQSKQPKTENVQILKTLLTHFQILSYLGNFDVNWSSDIISAMKIPAFFSFSLTIDSYPAECQFKISVYDKVLYSMVTPLVMVGVVGFFMFTKIIWRLKIKQIKFKDMDVFKLAQEFTFSVLVLLFFVHPSIIASISNIFGCKELGDMNYLKADMSIVCSDPKYIYWRSASIAYIALYCFGTPIFLGLYMFQKRSRLANPNSNTYNLLRFLVDGYTEKCYYWEIITMMQKLLVVVVSVSFSPALQIYFGSWILILSFTSTIFFNPFTSDALKKSHLLSMSVLYFTFMTSLLFRYSDLGESSEIVLVFFVIFSNILVAVVFLVKAGPSVLFSTFEKVTRLVSPSVGKIKGILQKHNTPKVVITRGKDIDTYEEMEDPTD